MNLKMGVVVLSVIIPFLIADLSAATTYFESKENTYPAGSSLPNSIYHAKDTQPAANGFARVGPSPIGPNVLAWATTKPNVTSMYNKVYYSQPPPPGGILYLAFFVKVNRDGGVSVWPSATNEIEGFDKALELVGTYRWSLNFGIRSQGGPANKWNIFVTNPDPGHFNPDCELYDTYWQNASGYGRGKHEPHACQTTMRDPFYAMDYERWYAVVYGVNFVTDRTGWDVLYINGTKVLDYKNIKTCESPCTHDRMNFWGTYNQPGYRGPVHSRYLAGVKVTDDFTSLSGYLVDPLNRSTVVPY
jgi:hypothetical protein